jgi:hypothetical protein
MNVLVTLTIAGTNTGPFNLYSNLDSFTTPFQTGVSKASLVSGLMVTTVPDGASTIRVKSTGTCTTSVDLFIAGQPSTTTTTTTQYIGPSTSTTTSSTSTSTSTTSTSTSSTSTSTTSTTTAAPINHPWSFEVTFGYNDAAGACASATPAITIWGDHANFLTNTIFYAYSNSNATFDGGALFYNYTATGQYAQISNGGIKLGGATCA